MVVAFTLWLCAGTSFAALDMLFSGPLYTPPDYQGEIVNGGALRLQSGTGPSISATFTRGGTDSMSFSENLVLFIDSRPGGFANNDTFFGSGYLGCAAAGYMGTGTARSRAVFGAPPGDSFGVDYILALGVGDNGAVFSIGADGVLTAVQQFSINPNDSQGSRTYTFSFDWNSIGVTDPSAGGFRFYSSYVADTGYRRLDSLQTVSGVAGFRNTITFNDYDVFGVDPVPEPINIALAVFGGLAVTGGVAARMRTRRKAETLKY